jgi:hypothetical protein
MSDQSDRKGGPADAIRGVLARSELGSVVIRELGPVEPSDVDAILRLRDSDERVSRLRTLIGAWEEQQREERKLRRTYALVLIIILAVELIAIFVAFFFIGTGKLTTPRWVGEGFLLAAFAQSTGLVLVVVKYLFPERSSDVLQLVKTSIAAGEKLIEPDER